MRDVDIFYLAPGDVLKGRVEPIIWMRTCEWLARYGFKTTLFSPYFYRKENVNRSEIFEHFGLEALFRIKILPTLLATRASGLTWTRINLLITYLVNLLPVFMSSQDAPVFYSKGQVCMQVVCFLERIFSKKSVKIYEIHSIGRDDRLVRLLNRMDLIVTNSRAVNSRLMEYGIQESKLLMAYNAPFSPGLHLDKLLAREQLDLDASETILLYAGKLYKENIDFFFRVGERLNAIGVKLHIVGGNPRILKMAHSTAEETGIENVTFHGFQPPEKVNVYLSSADFLFCSYSNDLPNIEQATPAKYFDYMQSDRPFFCSNNTAIKELLIDKENCFYFEPESPDSLVRKLSQCMNDTALLDEMRENNKKLIGELCWNNRINLIISRLNALLP